MDSIRKLPSYRPAHDSIPLLTRDRIAKLARLTRREWFAYLDRSAQLHVKDSTEMARELASANLSSMTRAPYARDFSVQASMTPAWFASDSARRLADVILTFEAPNGGWSKHVDFSQHPRHPGESYFTESADWEWISTIDNGATTEEIRFLSGVQQRQARSTVRARDPARNRLSPRVAIPQRMLSADLSTQGSYHDALTFNDDAIDQRASRSARRRGRQVSYAWPSSGRRRQRLCREVLSASSTRRFASAAS